MFISTTFCLLSYSDTRWDGQVIVVLGDTRVAPPYTHSSVTGSAKNQIQKLVRGQFGVGLLIERFIWLKW